MMRLFLLSCLSLCCLVSVAFPTSSQLSNIAEEKVQEREKRKMSGRSRRSTQPSSTIQLSGCSQRKDLPRNCHHAMLLGNSISGVYEIDPRDGLGSFNVSCEDGRYSNAEKMALRTSFAFGMTTKRDLESCTENSGSDWTKSIV